MAELLVKIGANSSEFRKEIQGTQRQLKRAFGPEALAASSQAAGLLGILTAGIGAAGVASVSLAGKLRLTQKALETLIGSSAGASQMIKDLKRLDDISAFSFDTYAKGAQKLLALGIAADKVIPTLTTIGDASAALGQGEEGIDRIVLALSQMTAKGKVSAQEMNQLAENNVRGWKYLSEEMGLSIAETMKQAENGAINGTAAVQIILAGMDKDFKGTMNKMADETPIVWNTIVSSAQQILAGIGPALDKGIGINKTLQGVRDYLVEFKKSIDEIGISETLEKMIPPGVAIAILGIAGAIMGAAIPALLSFAATAALALAPLWPFIAAGAALAVVFGAVASASMKAKSDNEKLMDSIYNTKPPVDSLADSYNKLTQKMNGAKPGTKELTNLQNEQQDLLNKIAKNYPQVVTAYDKIGNARKIDLSLLQQLIDKENELERVKLKNAREKAVRKTKDSLKDAVAEVAEDQKSIALIQQDMKVLNAKLKGISGITDTTTNYVRENIKKALQDRTLELGAWNEKLRADIALVEKAKTELAKLNGTLPPTKPKTTPTTTTTTTTTATPSLTQGGADEFDKIKDAAKRTSEAIEREWVQTTQTQLEQLDLWKAEQIAALDESKAGNADYQRDVERVSATYSARRLAILQDEQEKTADIWDRMADIAKNQKNQSGSIGLDGVEKEKFDIETGAADKIEDMKRSYRELAAEFSNSTKAMQEEFKAAWEANGIQFEMTSTGMLDFSKQVAAEQLTIEQQKQQDIANLHYERTKLQEDLDQAYNDGNIQRYMDLYSEEQAIFEANLQAKQEMMDLYRQIEQDATLTWMELMSGTMAAAYSGLENFFVDIINNAKSIGDAWQGLKNTILSAIGQMVSKWLAAEIMKKVFGKSALATETAASAAAAGTTAAAWAPAAAMTSLASFGANAAPAMAGIGATTALSMGLAAIPGLATGGITTGPTLAMIGEGKYDEAVVPLNKRAFEKVGLAGDKQSQPVNFQPVVQLQFLDTKDADRWLEGGGGARIEKYLKNAFREFAPVGI